MSLFNLFRREQPQSQVKPKSDLDSTFFNMKVKQLPSNFAQSILDLEMGLEFADTYELDTIKQLNDMYKLAIEYYVCEDPKKAAHFQRKLTSLLSNPLTLSAMENNGVRQPNALLENHYHKQLKSELGDFNAQSTVVVQQMIEGSNKKIERTSIMLNKQINQQQSELLTRLQKRSRSKNSRPNIASPQR